MSQIELQPGIYRHYKGQFYRVLRVARHSETEELQVVYQALYGERGWWVRPLEMFAETVQTAEGVQPRFARLHPQPPDAESW